MPPPGDGGGLEVDFGGIVVVVARPDRRWKVGGKEEGSRRMDGREISFGDGRECC